MSRTPGLLPVLMVQGTASSVGKSTLTAGLCRLFARRGIKVAPFKAQNMSNNAAVCRGGGEIGRAQYVQALAAGIEPTVDMNPILLKPQSGACQVIVRGKVDSTLDAQAYYGRTMRDLWPVVTDALDRLRGCYDLIVAEGAGSPAEINLRDRDLVNMRVAQYADARVVLVADIDKGGAFASLLGTWEWLEPEERRLVRGFVLNKFRGDAELLAPAPRLLEQRTGVPVLGVVPYLDELRLAEEDAASLTPSSKPLNEACVVEIAVARLPHLANFDEFDALAAEPGVRVVFVTQPAELRAPDLVIVPGTKATIPDLIWMHATGIAARVRWLLEHGTPVLGVCGGLQMLGASVRDPLRIESDEVHAPGLGLLPVTTEIGAEKRLERVDGYFRADLPGVWRALGGIRADGYEIHMGRTRPDASFGAGPGLLSLGSGDDGAVRDGEPGRERYRLDDERVGYDEVLVRDDDLLGDSGSARPDGRARDDGFVRDDGLVAGTYVHGLFERPAARAALLGALAAARGFSWNPGNQAASEPYDRLADAIEASIALDRLQLDL